MASRTRPPTGVEGPPTEFAEVPPPKPQMIDHSFTLQAIMELQKSLAQLATKVDRLVEDVKTHGQKIDDVQSKISFVKGAVWVIGTITAFGIAALGIAIRVSAPSNH